MSKSPANIVETSTEPVTTVTKTVSDDEKVPEEITTHLAQLKDHHHWDPNLPDEIFEEIDDALHTSDKDVKTAIAHELTENSPYPEVRAAVVNYDEGGHSNTIRAWTIGLLFATIGSALNMLFSMRQPYIVIPSYVAQVCAYPVGIYWAKVMPDRKFKLFGKEFNLNPGPFSKKEHTLIVIMANATFGGGAAYATDVLLAQRAFYGSNFGWAFEIFMCISTQMLGFGMAGFFHRFLVDPAAMIWPATLINTALFNALHDHTAPDPAKVAGWTIGRYRFFLYIMIGSFVWYWFPGLIAPFLSVFAWVTWIKPNSPVINQLFGGWTGISLIPMTFDWTQISGFNFSPLIAPWYAIANTLIGMVCWYWIMTAALHYSGQFYFKHLPISDSNSYDNTGQLYNVSKILTPQYTLDVAKYKEYSPLFLSTTFSLSYGLSFASMIAVLLHTGLFHGKDLWIRVRKVGREEEDVHTRLMARFKSVPIWWYAVVTLIMIGMGLGVVLGFPTHLSWWAFFISLIMALVWMVPIGIVQATTNIQIGLNVMTEFVIGYMQPGRPMAMMLFKTYGYISMYQGLYFLQDMKMGSSSSFPFRYRSSSNNENNRPLHESSTPSNFCRSNDLLLVVFRCPNLRHELGTRRNQRRLQRVSAQPLQLPEWTRVLQRIHHLGSHRACPHMVRWPALRQNYDLLGCGRSPTDPDLPRRTHVPQVADSVSFCTDHLRRCRPYPPGHAIELSLMGSSRLRL